MLIRRTGDTTWRAPAVTAYEDEAAIQALLAQSPELMPGAAGKRFAVAREVTLDAGYVDLMGVTPDGDITLIECKLKANPEIRRHVVGQILAYAATLWEMDYADLDAAFAARAGASLSSAVSAVAGESWDEETFRSAVSTNLATGRFRLVIAVDDITEELRRIVRFLNGHTTHELEVLALELRYVADSGVEMLFPKTYGEKAITPPPTPLKWNEERFFTAISPMLSTAGNDAARRLLEYARERGAKFQWGVGPYPSVSVRLTVSGRILSVFSISEWPKGNPKLYTHFEYLAGSMPQESLTQFAQDIYLVPGLNVSHDELRLAEYRKRPSVHLDQLGPDAVTSVEAALDRLLSS